MEKRINIYIDGRMIRYLCKCKSALIWKLGRIVQLLEECINIYIDGRVLSFIYIDRSMYYYL